MAIAFRNNSSTRSYSNAWYVNRPAGTATNDILVLWGFFPNGAVGYQVDLQQNYGFTPLANSVINDNGVQVWMFTSWKKVGDINSEPTQYYVPNHDGNYNYGSLYMAAFSGADPTWGWVNEVNTYATLDTTGLYGAFNNPGEGGAIATTCCGMRTSTYATTTPSNGWTQQYYAPQGGSFGTFMHTWKKLTSGTTDSWSVQTAANGAIASTTIVITGAANVVPSAATLTSPPNNTILDRTTTNRFTWQHNDDPWDGQSGYEYRYRIVGNPTWTTTGNVSSSSSLRDVAGSTFVAGDYEWQVRTRDQWSAFGPFSTSRFFTAATPPAGPSITSPVNNGTVDTTHTVTWSTSSQEAYQVRRVGDTSGTIDETTVYSDTGQVVDSATRSQLLSFPVNGRSEWVQVRIRSGGLWSAWSAVRVNVSYTPPPTPVLDVTAAQATATVTIAISNPPPSGAQPTVSHNVVLIDDGDGNGPQTKALSVSPNGNFVYYTPRHGQTYDDSNITVVAHGTNGATSES